MTACLFVPICCKLQGFYFSIIHTHHVDLQRQEDARVLDDTALLYSYIPLIPKTFPLIANLLNNLNNLLHDINFML